MFRLKMIALILFTGFSICLLSTHAFAIDTDTIYAEKCEMCHGADGKGTSQGIDFGVQDFTNAEWQASRSDDEFFHSITNGKEENPNYIPFGDMLSEEEIKAMAAHVRKFVK
ncbi:MAG: cytochrome c [Candidatus Scalindua sp.]|nr:cytochrome c [Candidatus Scalindua sp.]